MLPRNNFEIWGSQTGQFYHNHVILYHFKYFAVPSGGPILLLGGGGGGSRCVSPCMRASLSAYIFLHSIKLISFQIKYKNWSSTQTFVDKKAILPSY